MAQEYSISSGILDKYQGSDTTLVVPEGVTETSCRCRFCRATLGEQATAVD